MIRRNEKQPSVLAGFQVLPSLGSRQHAVRLPVLAEHAILSAQAFPPVIYKLGHQGQALA